MLELIDQLSRLGSGELAVRAGIPSAQALDLGSLGLGHRLGAVHGVAGVLRWLGAFFIGHTWFATRLPTDLKRVNSGRAPRGWQNPGRG